jgi:hypothetical protein
MKRRASQVAMSRAVRFFCVCHGHCIRFVSEIKKSVLDIMHTRYIYLLYNYIYKCIMDDNDNDCDRADRIGANLPLGSDHNKCHLENM